MTDAATPPSWRRRGLEALASALTDEFGKRAHPDDGLRKGFVERSVAPGSTVNVKGTGEKLEPRESTVTLEHHLGETDARSAVETLMADALGRLDGHLVTHLTAAAQVEVEGNDWRERIEAARIKASEANGGTTRVLVVDRSTYDEMELVQGVDPRVGATEDKDKDKPWPELVEQWIGAPPLVSNHPTQPLLIPASQWQTTLYVGGDWELFADPLDAHIELRARMECRAVVEPGSVIKIAP